MTLEIKTDKTWVDIHWQDGGVDNFLSFKVEALSPAEMQLVIEAAEDNDLAEVCNLWDGFVARW